MLAQVPIGQLLADASAALAAVAGVDAQDLPSATLVEGLETLLDLETRLRATQVRWLAAADTQDATVDECGRAARSWLIEEQRLNPGEAARRMRLARQLPGFPAVEAAFAAAEITAEHASVILAALLGLPVEVRSAVEPCLLDLARECPPVEVGRAVDALLEALGLDKAGDLARERRLAQRNVSLAETIGGVGSLSGTLSPVAREKLQLALAAAGAPCGPDDERTAGQRNHDALEQIADYFLSHGEVPDSNGERPRVIVTMGLDTLLGELEARAATLDSGVTISPATARRLACDAEIIPAVLGSRSELLDLGAATRVWNAAIRRAARLRDGGRCSFPSCRRPIAELHHIVWFSHGGRTCLDNSAWLCAFHHWLVHEGGWAMRREADGRCVFTAPDGRQRCSPRHPEAA